MRRGCGTVGIHGQLGLANAFKCEDFGLFRYGQIASGFFGAMLIDRTGIGRVTHLAVFPGISVTRFSGDSGAYMRLGAVQ